MSQMPDKILLHKDTKYNTTDEVFGYQYEFAQEIQNEGIENFIEYVPLDTFIEKVCDAYCKVCGHYTHTVPNRICRLACDYYKDFRKYIEGE